MASSIANVPRLLKPGHDRVHRGCRAVRDPDHPELRAHGGLAREEGGNEDKVQKAMVRDSTSSGHSTFEKEVYK